MGSENSTEKKPCGCDINVPYREPIDRFSFYFLCLRCHQAANALTDEKFKIDLENKKYYIIPAAVWIEIEKIVNKRLENILNHPKLNELISQNVSIF